MQQYELSKQHMAEQMQYAEKTRLLKRDGNEPIWERMLDLLKRSPSATVINETVRTSSHLKPTSNI